MPAGPGSLKDARHGRTGCRAPSPRGCRRPNSSSSHRRSRCSGGWSTIETSCRDLRRSSMALTQLDSNTALIIVDLQKGILGARFLHTIDEVVTRARALADKFRALGLPVVLVNVTGTAPGRTAPPPRQAAPAPAGWTEVD